MADAEAKQEVVHEWPPLESDPETFAKLAEFLGLEVRRTRLEATHGPAKIAYGFEAASCEKGLGLLEEGAREHD